MGGSGAKRRDRRSIDGEGGRYFQVRLPSGEQRMVGGVLATIGQVGNTQHENRKEGKAGVGRWKGRRPKVRGVAMNLIDHPHGGGEGRTSVVVTWSRRGCSHRGHKTRNNKRTESSSSVAVTSVARGAAAMLGVLKGPFVDDHLMKKVVTAKESNDRKVIKTWSLFVDRAGFRRLDVRA